jgi:hypothetical protein
LNRFWCTYTQANSSNVNNASSQRGLVVGGWWMVVKGGVVTGHWSLVTGHWSLVIGESSVVSALRRWTLDVER